MGFDALILAQKVVGLANVLSCHPYVGVFYSDPLQSTVEDSSGIATRCSPGAGLN